MTRNEIKWINEAKGEDGPAYWVSDDQRFDIEPLFSHGTRPWAYWLQDRINKTRKHCHSVRDAKQDALRILQKESEAKRREGDVIELRMALDRVLKVLDEAERKRNAAQITAQEAFDLIRAELKK
jgi:hypothetical protein